MVRLQRNFQRCNREFVDSQRAKQRVAPDALDNFPLSRDDPRLRPSEQFVSAEGNHGRPRLEARAHDRFRDPAFAEIGDAARAEIFVHRELRAAAECDQLFERGPLGKSRDAEIRRVHAQKQAGAFVDGAFVIADAGAVGGAHLAKNSAAFRHDVRDAEAVADFDEFAARDHHFVALGEGVQHQKDGGGVVVDHDRGFGAGDLREEVRRVRVALAALASLDIVFEVGIARGRFGDFGNCLGGERGAAQIGVQNDSGRVDYAREETARAAASMARGNARGDRADAYQAARRVAFQLRAQFLEHIARRMGGDCTSRLLNQTRRRRAL